MGKNRSTIANYLRLLKLDPIIQTGMRDGFISMGHGRALINVEGSNDQLDIYEKVLKDSLSVRETEAIVRNLKQPNVKNASTKKVTPSFANDAKKELTSLFDSKVDVKISDSGKGQFVFPFKNREEFQRILKLIKGEK